MITAGGDGTLSCWGWDFNEKGKGRSTAAVNACKARLSQLADVRREQDAVLKEMQTFEPEVVECKFLPLCDSERWLAGAVSRGGLGWTYPPHFL